MKYRFNLLPDSFKPRDIMEMGRWFVFLVLFLFTVGLVMIGIMYEKRFIDIQRSITRLNYQKNQLLFDEGETQKVLVRIEAIQAKDSRDRQILKILDSLVNERIMWSRTMAQITYIVPDGAWLNSISSSGSGVERTIKFRGTALSNKWIARFIFYLENHSDFSGVRLEYSRLLKVGGREVYSFEVIANLRPPSGRT
ncbi:MAG: PilN domain-containing protein [bacterium]